MMNGLPSTLKTGTTEKHRQPLSKLSSNIKVHTHGVLDVRRDHISKVRRHNPLEDLPIGIFRQEGRKLAMTITRKHSVPLQCLHLPIGHRTRQQWRSRNATVLVPTVSNEVEIPRR